MKSRSRRLWTHPICVIMACLTRIGRMDFTQLRMLVLDVDGVLTDGRIIASGGGDDAKWFHVQDGCAIKLWQRSGGGVAVLSGRNSTDVKRRAHELGIGWVRMGIEDKLSGLKELLRAAEVEERCAAYVGDDLPDAVAMRVCGFSAAPADAVPSVKRIAHYVARRGGGGGAVAEVIEFLLRKQQRWSVPAAK